MVVYGVWIINKAGGLVYQRNYAGPYLLLSSSNIPRSSWADDVILRLNAEGLPTLTPNEYLVLAGTLHGIHAITAKISPTGRSSGVQVIEGETFKLNIMLTLTGESSQFSD